jgi:hypothetical protein
MVEACSIQAKFEHLGANELLKSIFFLKKSGCFPYMILDSIVDICDGEGLFRHHEKTR